MKSIAKLDIFQKNSDLDRQPELRLRRKNSKNVGKSFYLHFFLLLQTTFDSLHYDLINKQRGEEGGVQNSFHSQMHKVTVRDLNFFSIRKIHQSFPISKPRPHTSLLIHISRKNCKYFKILCVLWYLVAWSMNLQIFLKLLGYIYQSKYARYEYQHFSFGNLPGNLLLHLHLLV